MRASPAWSGACTLPVVLAFCHALGRACLVATLALALVLSACAAPTLPLPPPTALSSAPDATGNVTVTGRVNPSAYVFALDEDRGDGVIVSADAGGAYSATLRAATGDTVTIWQMVGTNTGQLTTVIVP